MSASRHEAVTGLGRPPPPPYGPRMPRWLSPLLARTPRPRDFPPDRRLDRQRQERGRTGRSGPPRRERRDYAVVLLDGHGPLAFRAAGHWAARGHEAPPRLRAPRRDRPRPLLGHAAPVRRRGRPRGGSSRTPRPATRSPSASLAQRNLDSLTDRPWTKEWLDAAIGLCLSQPQAEPLASLLGRLPRGVGGVRAALGDCRPAMTSSTSSATWSGCGARTRCSTRSRRARAAGCWKLVCGSEVVRLRSRPGPFDWLDGPARSDAHRLRRRRYPLAGDQADAVPARHHAGHPRRPPALRRDAGAAPGRARAGGGRGAGPRDAVRPARLPGAAEGRPGDPPHHPVVASTSATARSSRPLLANAPWQAWYQSSPRPTRSWGRRRWRTRRSTRWRSTSPAPANSTTASGP